MSVCHSWIVPDHSLKTTRNLRVGECKSVKLYQFCTVHTCGNNVTVHIHVLYMIKVRLVGVVWVEPWLQYMFNKLASISKLMSLGERTQLTNVLTRCSGLSSWDENCTCTFINWSKIPLISTWYTVFPQSDAAL